MRCPCLKNEYALKKRKNTAKKNKFTLQSFDLSLHGNAYKYIHNNYIFKQIDQSSPCQKQHRALFIDEKITVVIITYFRRHSRIPKKLKSNITLNG